MTKWVKSHVNCFWPIYVQVLEQQNISGKNLFDEFEQQVSSNNLFNHEALEEPNVAVKNLFQEEDQQFSSKNLDVQQEALDEPNVDQQFSAKKLDAQLEMEELLQLILFAIHDQLDTLSMKNVDSVQGSNDAKVDVNPTVAVNSLRVPLERDHKVSRYLQDPYMIQPDSTEPNHKVRARHKKNKKRCMPLTTPDGKLIPAWTEDLFRPSNAPKMRVLVPKEIINFLPETEEQRFYFPWSMDGTFVYNNFWQGLLGIGKESRGWLSNMHLDLWVLYLWHFRPTEADWAIAGPFFNTFMLGYELPCCYADGVTYGVPWFAQSVEKRKYIGYLQNSIFDQVL
ncbi:hypothetical protein Tco_1452145 [Tanacetum coccineum]